MKRLLIAIMSLALVFGLAACAPKKVTVFQGFGVVESGRTGPGKDDTGTQVWSFNEVYANVLFDKDGKILSVFIDQLEVATPNYDGAGMPHFSGFPGQGGYNLDANHDGVVDGKTVDTPENFLAEVNSWATKRARGAEYKMTIGTWTSQMDRFQQLFVGKTVAEVEAWAKKYTSDLNGRPLVAAMTKPEDIAKFAALTADEKTALADVTTAATMSLKDSHGDILGALKAAYANKVENVVQSAAFQGFGIKITPRTGPGKDDTGTQVWSFNEVYANTIFDKDGKILSIHIDAQEVATPNYDGAGMPHFSGFPGQTLYNVDANHDGVVDGKSLGTPEAFLAEVATWQTKRARGDEYKMTTGTWAKQMDKFEKLFVGKTVEEVEAWAKKYTSDLNGRPLIAAMTKPEDIAKFAALTADEKTALADVTTAATMSLNDSHGNILAAIKASFTNKFALTLK
jgi:hypothetical protein